MEGTREEGRVGLGGGKGRRKSGQGSAGFGDKEHGEETRVGEALVVGELEDSKVDCLGELHECIAVDRAQLAADKTGDGDQLRPAGICPPFVARRELPANFLLMVTCIKPQYNFMRDINTIKSKDKWLIVITSLLTLRGSLADFLKPLLRYLLAL